MWNPEWSQWSGMRRAMISLVMRGTLAAALYAALLYGFLMFLQSVGTTHNPRQFVIFSLVAGALTGIVMSWRLTDTAGFVSMFVTLPAVIVAGLSMLAGTSVASMLYGSPLEAHLRLMIIGSALILAGTWIVWVTLVD